MTDDKARSDTLRAALDRVIQIRLPAAFEAAFGKLQEQHNHTVRIVRDDKDWLDSFNCYAFALGIVCSPRYQALVRKHSTGALANSGFVSILLNKGELTLIEEPDANAGNIVLYFLDGALRHAGVVITDNRRVRSKWGPSELYEHSLWEVPASYGQVVKFAYAPESERIVDLLEEHVA